jgi:hypothetical protein
MKNSYLSSTIKQLNYYKSLADKTFDQLTDDELNWQYTKDSNSIATIVKHMNGNMLSRWTNFLTEDGEKPWRTRDAEFETAYLTKEELVNIWETGWTCVFNAITSLTDDDLERIIYIRNEGHTVTDAINRQLAHYPYHIGQIVLIGTQLKGENWQSLSIPKGQSNSYNADKFSQPKEIRHFTDKV